MIDLVGRVSALNFFSKDITLVLNYFILYIEYLYLI